MRKHGKRFNAARKLVDLGARYPIDQGVDLITKIATTKFDETVDISVRLGVNPRLADQMVRGAISLPHGIGKSVRVVVFAEGDAARTALEAGADVVGADDLINKIMNEGWVEFDKAISVRNLMAKVGRLGKVLGPRGLMPNPKTNTVVGPEQIAEVVKEVKAGRVDFRVEKAGIVHCPVGKAGMGGAKLKDNILALMQLLIRLKPSTAKGTYVRSVTISSTMSPGVKLDINELQRLALELV